jgi:hypothetical protein
MSGISHYLAGESPESIRSTAMATTAAELASTLRLWADSYVTAQQRAKSRGEPTEWIDALIVAALDYEQSLTKRAGGPDRRYVPRPNFLPPKDETE